MKKGCLDLQYFMHKSLADIHKLHNQLRVEVLYQSLNSYALLQVKFYNQN